MAMKKATFLLAFLLLVLPGRALAQFLGYTSPQTVQVQVFNNVAAPAVSASVQNLGQSIHFVSYRCTAGTIEHLEILLEASYDNVVWIPISHAATNPLRGSIFATGYYPLVHVNLRTMDSPVAQQLSAWYSGTSTSVAPESGIFRTSGSEVALVANDWDATFAGNFQVNLPFQSTEGTLIFVPTAMTGVTTATGARLEVRLSYQADACSGTANLAATYAPLVGGNAVQMFRVPARAAPGVCVIYDFAAAPTGGTYDIWYAFGSSQTPQGVDFTFAALNAVGITAGFSVQALHPNEHTVSLAVTGGPANCSFQLEGSLNSTTGVDGTWFALSGAVDCTVAANRMFHVVNKPVPWVRGDLTALAGGAAPTVTLSYLGAR